MYVGEPAVMPPVIVDTLPQREADLRAAFGSSEPGTDEQTLDELRKCLDEVVAAAVARDAAAFRAKIDVDRFMLEAKKTGLIQGLTRELEEAYAQYFRDGSLSFPGPWVRHAIVRVKALEEQPTSVVVYAYAWDKSQYAVEARLWMTRSPSGWMVYDWEVIPFGPRRSFEVAVQIQRSSDPRLEEHYQITLDISNADEKRNAGDLVAGGEILKRAEARSRVPELADRQQVQLAYAWWRQGRNRECLRCARQVVRPAAVPGVLYMQAVMYQELRSLRRALDFGQKYEQATGGGPQIWELLANVHRSLGESDKAAEYWKKLLRYDPDNVTILQSLAGSLGEHDANLIVECLKKTSQPAESAAGIAERLVYSGAPDVLRAVSDFVAGLEPESARAAYLQGLVAQADENHAEAAAFFKIAFLRDADEELHKSCVERFLNAMLAADKLVAGYEQAPDALEAFQHLLSGNEDDGSGLTLPQRKALIDAHRQKHPDDPQLHYQAAQVLEEEEDYDGALRELTTAGDQAANDNDRAQFRRAIVALLHQAGRDVAAYQTIPPADETFRQLVQLHRWNERPEDVVRLKELHQLHQAANPQDGWLELCAALIQIRGKNPAEPCQHARREFDSASDESLKSQYQWLVVDLALKAPDFAAAFRVFADSDEALATLGQRCWNANEWDKLDALLEWSLKDRPHPSPEWHHLKVVAAWNKRDYAAVIQGLEGLSQSPGPGSPSGKSNALTIGMCAAC